jgi:AAA15 family ATPase/GTPase
MNITKFGLSNFRIFKEHFDFDLAPIMVLTGPNNSGKSSLSKALLLLKENEKIINSGSHYYATTTLNYFKGEHDLGNHKYVVNTEDEETVFSFTFFQDYKFCVMVDNNARFDWDYLITTNDNELVIGQFGGVIKIDIWNLRQYLSDRIGYPECLDNLAQAETTNRTNANHVESSLLRKIWYVIICLSEIGEKVWSIEVNLYNSSIEVLYRGGEPKNEEEKLERKNFENIILSIEACSPSELQENLISLLETLVKMANLKFSGKMISLELVEKMKLNEKEIQFLIPTSESGFFSFSDLIYIKTIKEPLKRAYSSSDLSSFQFLINEQISQDIEQSDNPKTKIRTNRVGKPKEFDPYDDGRSEAKESYNLFTKKWLKEFEIGEELSYGYDKKNDIYFIKVDDKSLPEYGLGFGLIIHILLALSNNHLRYSRFSGDSKDSNCDDLKLIFPSTYIIEEPETGLHPAFQSKMAEMIVDIQKTFHVNLIIETHSEYFIRELQYLTATNKIKPDEAIIYYFNNPKKVPENEEQIKKITIDKDGNLSDSFGTGFIDEGTNLKFKLLRQIKNQQN